MSFELQIALALLALVGNAFFVGAEFGLVSARRSSIEPLALEGSRPARITLGAMEQVSLMLAGAQLGITLCSLIFGAIGEPLFAHWLEEPLHAAGMPDALLHPISFAIALAVLAYVHVVLGEMVPKNLAIAGPTRTALLLTPILVAYVKVAGPIVNFLNTIANGILRLLGINPKREIASSFNRDEVAGFVKESHKEGLLSEDEKMLLTGALSFDRKTVRNLLLPLDQLVTLPYRATIGDIELASGKTGFSRFPINDAKGKLAGYLHIKDVLHMATDNPEKKLPASVIRALPSISADTSLRLALLTMQRAGAHLAKVTNGRGRALGVIALEDLLEELVGVIRDETQR